VRGRLGLESCLLPSVSPTRACGIRQSNDLLLVLPAGVHVAVDMRVACMWLDLVGVSLKEEEGLGSMTCGPH
jgi:hypothetical protein